MSQSRRTALEFVGEVVGGGGDLGHGLLLLLLLQDLGDHGRLHGVGVGRRRLGLLPTVDINNNSSHFPTVKPYCFSF